MTLKKILYILTLSSFILSYLLTACSASGQNYFNATVLEIEQDYILVQPAKDEKILKFGDKIKVSKETVSTTGVPELSLGEEIRIVYNKVDPPQLDIVFAIYLLSELEKLNDL